MSMRERGGKYDSSAPLVPLIQGGSVYHCISILKIARYRTFLASSCFSVGSIRHYFPSPGRQLTDRAGARHGNLTPPRISPSCPHCVIPIPLGAVAGQEYHDRLTGSSRFDLPFSNPGNGCTLAALFSRLFMELCSTGGSWRIFGSAVPLLGGPSTNVSRCRIFSFQSTVERQNIFQPSLSIAEFRMI